MQTLPISWPMRSIGHPDYVYTPWSDGRKSAASQRAKDRWKAKHEWRARAYDGDKEWPDGVSLGPEDAPAIAWIQCMMPQLAKDAEMISEHEADHFSTRAMLALLVIIKRRRADIPFICAVTGFNYSDVLVMVVRAKLGWVVLSDDQPNMGLFPLDDDRHLHIALILGAMLMSGIMMRSIDNKWLLGDHGDLDANAPQHMMNDILHAA